MRALLLLCILSLFVALSTSTALAEERGKADFSLHEWGVMHFVSGEALAQTSAFEKAPKLILEPVPFKHEAKPKKPVIYLNPGEAHDPKVPIDITVSVKDGTLKEVWPTWAGGEQPGDTQKHSWLGVTIDVGEACGAELAPALEDLPCTSIEAGFCEAYELKLYLDQVPDCLSLEEGGGRAPVLLYRGEIPSLTPPVKWSEEGLTSSHQVALGPVFVSVDGQVYLAESLSPGETLKLESMTLVEDLQRDVLTLLSKKGLLEREGQDFLRAWSALLLGDTWSVFGFYDGTTIDTLLPLGVSPKPSEQVRVLSFLVDR